MYRKRQYTKNAHDYPHFGGIKGFIFEMGSSDDSVDVFKGVMMAVIFISGVMGGFFPSAFNQHKQALSFLNCFSGGVILSAGLMVSVFIHTIHPLFLPFLRLIMSESFYVAHAARGK